MKSLFIIILFLFGINQSNLAQVEHNYPVGPQNVNCDSLKIAREDYPAAVQKIENASWRYQQTFSIRRQFGLRNARFYSCDARSGYLLIVSDKKRCIFLNVTLKNWEELTSSSDPDGFVTEVLEKKFSSICEKSEQITCPFP